MTKKNKIEDTVMNEKCQTCFHRHKSLSKTTGQNQEFDRAYEAGLEASDKEWREKMEEFAFMLHRKDDLEGYETINDLLEYLK